MGVRLLHLADVHLQRPFVRLLPEAASVRRAALRATFERALTLAAGKQVDAICIAGDLFERENATPALGEYLAAEFSRLAPTPVLIAPGNHDHYSPGCLYDRAPFGRNVHVFRSSAPEAFEVGTGAVLGAAFTTLEASEPLQLPRQASATRPVVGLFHADLVDGRVGSSYRPLSRQAVAESDLAMVLLGHQHVGMVDLAGRVAYPGSLEPLDRTEVGPRWVLLLNVDATGARVETCEIASARVRGVTVDVSTMVTRSDFESRLRTELPDGLTDYVALTLVGVPGGGLALDWPQAVASARVRAAELIDQTNPYSDWQRFRTEQSVRGRFVRSMAARIEGAPDAATRATLTNALAVGLGAFDEKRVGLP